MNQEIKELWVAALRSGEYEQGTNALSRDGKHCCLGVLCELAVQAGVVGVYRNWNGDGMDGFGDDYAAATETLNTGTLPVAVWEWAELDGENPYIESRRDWLAPINDAGASFKTIADIIKADL